MSKKPKPAQVLHSSAMTPVMKIADDKEHDPRRGKPNIKADAGLTKSIGKIGLLQSIVIEKIEPQDGCDFRIVAGRRRLRACKTLVSRKHWQTDAQIPTIMVDAETAAKIRTMALAENTLREAMHPVDAYEQVRDILADGGDDQDAADALGMTVLQVRQFEALGKIAPEIRDAWRAGKIDDSTAKAFTLTDDHARQVEVYNRLKKGYGLYAHGVRSELGANQHDQIYALAVVGEEAYSKAGGVVRHDLFDEKTIIISDTELLSNLANERIEQECQRLVADGWSWALSSRSIQNRWDYKDQLDEIQLTPDEQAEIEAARARIEEIDQSDDIGEDMAAESLRLDARVDEIEHAAFERACTPEIKAATGCIVSIGREGIAINYGLLAPGQSAPGSEPTSAHQISVSDEAEDLPNASISGALTMRLSEQVTRAAILAIAANPTLAFRLLTAAMHSRWESPLKVSSQGLDYLRHDHERQPFHKAFEQATGRQEEVARTIAGMLDMRIMNANGPRTYEAQAILEAIGEETYSAMALKIFDPADYFASASAARIDEFVQDLNEIQRRNLGDKVEPIKPPKGKKAEKAAWAAAHAEEVGWLPPELRFNPPRLKAPPRDLDIDPEQDANDEIDEQETDDEAA